MITQSLPRLTSSTRSLAHLNKRRRADWLLSIYSNPVWTVTDTLDSTKTSEIDFRVRMPTGESLVEAGSLYRTVKEYAWWVRDPRYSRIEDAHSHTSLVRCLTFLAHGLALRGIRSFAHLQPYDVEQLVEDCRFGNDAVLKASERVGAFLEAQARQNAKDPQPFGGLPQYVIPSRRIRTTRISSQAVIAACNLPASTAKLSRVAILIGRAACANNLSSGLGLEERKLEPSPNITAQALLRWLMPLEQLYAMRLRLEAETITFKPFSFGAGRVATVKGSGVKRTPIPPPTLVLHLLEQSVRWIFDRRDSVTVGAPSRVDVLRMASACWIVVAAFTARRDEEIDDLRENCLRGDDVAGWQMHVYIEKTLQQREWIPVPAMVARAVEVMSAISAGARQQTGTDQLLQWRRPNGSVTRLDVGRYLDDFAAAVQVPLYCPRNGPATVWHWHPHQFRRFFAVLYFYRFEGATIEALSHQLRHFSLEMTRHYVTQDPEVAALWTDVEWGYMSYVARTIVAGERSVSGAAGERLKKTARRIIDVFRRKLQIASPERVGASLTLVMQRQGMVLTPTPWVTCSCPRTSDAAAKAACQRDRSSDGDAVGPNFARAGPSVCSFCPHAVIEGTRRGVVDAEVDHLEVVSASRLRAGTLFGALEEARVVELRLVRDTRYAAAKPLANAAMEQEHKE